MALLAVAFCVLTCLSSQAQTSSYVPPIVVSSVSPVPTTVYTKPTGTQTNVINPTEVFLDACGNIYFYDFGGNGNNPNGQGGSGTLVTEIPAGGGGAIAVENVGQYYQTHGGQDPTHASLIIGQDYGTGENLVPLTNCVPQTSQAKHVGGGSGALFYYYQPGYAVGDFAGNTYITSNGTCCVTGSYYLIQEVGGNGTILLANQPKEITTPAVDKQKNVYFVAGGVVYELPFLGGTAQPYAAAPVAFGNYANPVGLSFDSAGNMYVADQGVSSIYEIPYEAGTSSSALNIADQFVVARGVNINVSPAVNARGDIYYTATNATNVSKLSLGNANFNSVPVGQTVTRTLNFQFNAAVTPAAIQLPTGVFSSVTGATGTVACAAGTAYAPTGTSNCQVTIAFTPTAVGKQTGAVILADAKGNSLATAYLEGVGQGPLVTLDPGTVTPTGSGLKSPAGVAVDGAGNAYIADASNNAIIELPAGGGAAVNLTITTSASPASISGPLGVAVDGAGNLFVADTGNNRVLEVPFVNGALNTSGAVVIASGLKSPASVFAHTNGDIYIADTGDNNILSYPNFGGVFGAPASLGVGLSAPLAVALDASGNVFIADSGNNQILEIPLGGPQETVAAGILNPSALAADTSGALFVVDQGNFRVLRIPAVGGVLNPNAAAEVGLGVAAPYGLAIDPSSNLYVTDQKDVAAYTIARSQIGLSFGDLAVGTSSSPLPLTVENAGDQQLVFGTPYFTETGNSADFAMTSPTGACADGVTLGAGSTCDLVTNFTPGASGSRSATIAFTSTPGSTATVTLTGSGVSSAPTSTKLAFNFAAGANSPFYGEPLTFAATVAPSGSAAPTGNVSFVIDGIQVGLLPLASGTATLQLNSGLTGGAHTVYATYKGDSANNGSSSAPLAITISRAPTTATIVVTKVPFNNPYSLRHSTKGSCDVIGSIRNTTFNFPAILSDGLGVQASVSSPGVGVPGGTLTFYSDGNLINGTPPADPKAPQPPTSVTPLLPAAGGTFAGGMTTTADILGDGDMLGENNILLGPHGITVVYSGDTNYLPSTSAPVLVTVVDVSPTTPVTLPNAVVGAAPYCTSSSSISGSRPSQPATYAVAVSTGSIPVTASAPGTAVFTISSLGNWQGTVLFACSNLPKYTTCTTNPGIATVVDSTPGSTILPPQVTLTITTNVPPSIPTAQQSALLWPAAVFLGLVVLAMRRRVQRIQSGLALFGVALLFLGGMAGLSSCGAGTNNVPSVVTPAGSYPITVTLTGAQPANLFNGQGDTEETMKPDLPYSIPLTLVVK